MDLSLIVGGILAAGASGIGLGVGARLVPLGLRAGRDLRDYNHSPEAHRQRRVTQVERSEYRLANPPGRRRDSSIVGLYEDTLRRKDGSYTRLYDFPLPTTFNAHEAVNESVCDEIGRLLAVPKPPGTVMQFRYAVSPDPGRSIAAHLRARSYDRVYLPACRLHDNNVDFYKALADACAFRTEHASFNITVPVHLADDDTSRGLSAFVPAVLREVRDGGIKQFPALSPRLKPSPKTTAWSDGSLLTSKKLTRKPKRFSASSRCNHRCRCTAWIVSNCGMPFIEVIVCTLLPLHISARCLVSMSATICVARRWKAAGGTCCTALLPSRWSR